MLNGKTVFITGASRGIGKAIALRCARAGANIVVASKTSTPHEKLPGTIHSTVAEVEELGGQALACSVDVQHEEQIVSAVSSAVKRFGGIDILINNAGAIDLSSTESITSKKYHLIMNINAKGSFFCIKHCLPYLKKSQNAHILNICPPLSRIGDNQYFANGLPYTVSKFCMTLYTYGMSAELRNDHIAVNALWPKSPVWTAAVQNLAHVKNTTFKSPLRNADIMADAAYSILTKKCTEFTGQFVMDEDLLISEGLTDLTKYNVDMSKL